MSKENKQRDNQFKDNIKNSLYQEICNKNLKLLRQIDKINNENLDLTEKINYLTNLLDNLDLDLKKMEDDFKALNKPLIIEPELINFSNLSDEKALTFSIPTITILFLSLTSLLKYFLTLRNDYKSLKTLFQGTI